MRVIGPPPLDIRNKLPLPSLLQKVEILIILGAMEVISLTMVVVEVVAIMATMEDVAPTIQTKMLILLVLAPCLHVGLLAYPIKFAVGLGTLQ